jgi:hypothetical protein
LGSASIEITLSKMCYTVNTGFHLNFDHFVTSTTSST